MEGSERRLRAGIRIAARWTCGLLKELEAEGSKFHDEELGKIVSC